MQKWVNCKTSPLYSFENVIIMKRIKEDLYAPLSYVISDDLKLLDDACCYRNKSGHKYIMLLLDNALFDWQSGIQYAFPLTLDELIEISEIDNLSLRLSYIRKIFNDVFYEDIVSSLCAKKMASCFEEEIGCARFFIEDGTIKCARLKWKIEEDKRNKRWLCLWERPLTDNVKEV